MKYHLLFHAHDRQGQRDTEMYYIPQRKTVLMVTRNTDPAVCVTFGTQRTEIPVSRVKAMKAARNLFEHATKPLGEHHDN